MSSSSPSKPPCLRHAAAVAPARLAPMIAIRLRLIVSSATARALPRRLLEPALAFRALKELDGLILLLRQGDGLQDDVAVGAFGLPEVWIRRLNGHGSLPSR